MTQWCDWIEISNASLHNMQHCCCQESKVLGKNRLSHKTVTPATGIPNIKGKTVVRPTYFYNGNSYPAGGRLNKKIPSYKYRKFHCGDKTILRPSYLHNEISFTGKTTSLYWIRVLVAWHICIETVFDSQQKAAPIPLRYAVTVRYGEWLMMTWDLATG